MKQIYKIVFLIALSLLIVAQASAVPTKVGYWKFNTDCDGGSYPTVLYDDLNSTWTNGYHGHLLYQSSTGSYPVWSPGYEGRSLYFNRYQEQLVEIQGTNNNDPLPANPFNFDYNSKFTIACYYKYDVYDQNGDNGSTNALGSLVNKMRPAGGGNQNYVGWDLAVFGGKNASNQGKIRFHLIGSWPQQSITIDSKQKTVPGIWHYVALVFDGNDNGNPILSLYVDGQLAQYDVVYYDPQYNTVTSQPLRIGARSASMDPDNRAFKGYIDEVSIYNSALTSSEVLSEFQAIGFNPEFCGDNPFGPSDLVLWLDPKVDLYKEDGITPAVNDGDPVALWKDQERSPFAEDASMAEANRIPKLRTGTNGIQGILNPVYTTYTPGVQFTTDYASNHYGFSDILTAPNDPEITSAQTDEWNPNGNDELGSPYSKNRSLMFVFQPNDNWNTHAYYAAYGDNRQCMVEAGGPLSGYNAYILNGKLCFGMWNRFERKFLVYDPPMSTYIYPLTGNQVYLAHLEYRHKEGNNGGHFRAILNKGTDITGPVNTQNISSPLVDFAGLTLDGEDRIGVGGATRTSYHDYNTGETYSDHYNGKLGDVMVYQFADDFYINPTVTYFMQFADIYSYLDTKYNQLWAYAPTSSPMNKIGDWKVVDLTNYDLTKVQLSEAYPNPFVTKTSFGISLPETSIVSVDLYDASGNKVQNFYSGSLSKGMHDFTIDGTNLNSGMYMFRVTGQDFVQSGKVILSK